MGIGEPLDNFDNVLKFLKLVSAPEGNGLSLRHITLSTCGIVPRINELAELGLGLTLSVSLHCPDNEGRSEIMPVNRTYNIKELICATKKYAEKTGIGGMSPGTMWYQGIFYSIENFQLCGC